MIVPFITYRFFFSSNWRWEKLLEEPIVASLLVHFVLITHGVKDREHNDDRTPACLYCINSVTSEQNPVLVVRGRRFCFSCRWGHLAGTSIMLADHRLQAQYRQNRTERLLHARSRML